LAIGSAEGECVFVPVSVWVVASGLWARRQVLCWAQMLYFYFLLLLTCRSHNIKGHPWRQLSSPSLLLSLTPSKKSRLNFAGTFSTLIFTPSNLHWLAQMLALESVDDLKASDERLICSNRESNKVSVSSKAGD